MCRAELIGHIAILPPPLPVIATPVEAGFPSPAEDYLEGALDLSAHYVRHPASTYFLRAHGDSMVEAGIQSGDLLIVDRSLTPASGRIVIAALDGQMTVKRLIHRRGRILLAPENPEYPVFDVTDYAEASIWGVVTAAIHEF